MLSDYITKMYEENENKLNSLQREMDEIVTDINNEQAMMERLQYEKKLDTNIFSPRKIDTKADEKTNECRIKIKGMNQRMEYVSQMVEECLNNRNELAVLLKEAQEKGRADQSNNSLQEESDTLITYQAENMSGILLDEQTEDMPGVSIVDQMEDKSSISNSDQMEDKSGISNFDQMEDKSGISNFDQMKDKSGISIVDKTEDFPDVSLNENAEKISDASLNNKTEDLPDSSIDSKKNNYSDTLLDNKTNAVSGTRSETRLIEISEVESDGSLDNNTENKRQDKSVDRIENSTENAVNIVNEVSDEKMESANTFPEMDEPGEISALNPEDAKIQREEEIKKNLLSFLNDLYKHNEIALALVNGNKNKCKSEIRNSMSMIREYAKKVENGDS